ncbi:hypothetical protein N665_0794s0012 [Sinapis alba]|nr:hypothetical protein N665_0794s0012 [Sinapis alba]
MLFLSCHNEETCCRIEEALERESAATDELVKKYGIFDIKGSRIELDRQRCNKDNPCPPLVRLYAMMGLHRYNLLQGTKYKVKHVRKYIETRGSAARSFYMTVDAIDTAAAAASGGSSSSLLQTFQTQISEEACGEFILSCDIARIRGESKNDEETMVVDTSMPEWPPENPFERHCLGKEEVKSCDWIRLYVRLALATRKDRRDGDSKLKFKILKVATDLVSPPHELNAINATFYILYNVLPEAAARGEGSDHIAIVRRRFDEDTGCFVVVGQSHLSSEILSKKRKIVGEDSSSVVDKRIKTGLPDQISPELEDHEAANQETMSSD